MIRITGYNIMAKINESANSLVFRAHRNQDNLPVIIKALKEDYPALSEISRYRHEYEILRSLEDESIIKAYDIQKYENGLAIVLEDFGGESLKKLMIARAFTLEEFFHLAIKSSSALGEIHRANIIHKNINTENIIYNPETGQGYGHYRQCSGSNGI